MNQSTSLWFGALSIAAASLPFAFAAIRAVQTGNDFRYFWVALAGVGGAAVVMTLSTRAATRRQVTVGRPAGVFVVATLFSVLMGLLIGTRLGPGLLVVAGSFGCCFGAGSLFHAVARR